MDLVEKDDMVLKTNNSHPSVATEWPGSPRHGVWTECDHVFASCFNPFGCGPGYSVAALYITCGLE